MIREEEGEALGAAEERFSRWASQILPELPELPPSSKEPSFPFLPPLKSK
jgi:hypothetical protein